MAEGKREHGCLSLLLGLLFIFLMLTLLFGWDFGGKHYGIGCRDGSLRLIWGKLKEEGTATGDGSESQSTSEPSSNQQ